MTYLLDVAPLVALLYPKHVHFHRVAAWEKGLDLAVCPISEIGFIRVSSQVTIGLSLPDAQKALRDWRSKRKPAFIACDLDGVAMDLPTVSSRTTDYYLASLAAKHGMKLATLDQDVKHPAAFLIPA
jgi:predicted nucleic acid-binding protein